jgi:hypothetical protein
LFVIYFFGCERKGTLDSTSPDLSKYPQDTPYSCLSSMIKAIELYDIEYLINHLLEPNVLKEDIENIDYELYLNTISENTKKNVSKFIPFLKAEIQYEPNDHAILVLNNYEKQIYFRCINKRWYFMYSFDE